MRLSAAIVLTCMLFAPFIDAGEGDAKCDLKSNQILHSMCDFYGSIKSFSAHVGMYRIALSPGNKAERWVNYDVAVQRPNKLSFVLRDGDEITYAWVCDGTQVITYMSALDKYTLKRAPATIPDLLKKEEIGLIRGTVENMLFIDLLLREKPFEAVLEDVESVKFIDSEKVDHAMVDRIQFAGNGAKWDCCIQEGAQPFIRKAVPDLTPPGGNPPETSTHVTVSFDKWSANQELSADRFKFTPPSNAKKVTSFFKKEAPPNPILNNPAPRTRLELLDGHKIDIASYKGKKIVILDFWGIHCVPCIYGLPKLISVANAYKDRNVVLIALNDSDTRDEIQEFLDKRDIHPTVAINNHPLFEAYHITTMPKTVIIDKNGIVRVMHGGTTDDIEKTLSGEIDALLEGRELPPPKNDDDDDL